MDWLVRLIWLVRQVLILVVVVYVVLTYIVPPENPVRSALARIAEPMLRPIRRWVPLLAGLDISPLLLVLLIDLAARFLIWLLWTVS